MVARYKASTALANSPPEERVGFKKGDPRPPNAGRRKGSVNKNTALIKDAIALGLDKLGELAAVYATREVRLPNGRMGRETTDRILGWRATGKGGATGYMIWLGRNHPNAFATLIGKTIPLQVNATATIDATVTSKFSEVDLKNMTLAEKLALQRDMIGLTRRLPPPEETVTRMLEGTSKRVSEK